MSADVRLTRIQARAVAALLTSRTLTEAATTAGVSERTLRRWMAAEPFAAAYREAARESAREAVSALQACQLEAVGVLRGALQGGSPADRTRAARAILELGVRLAEEDLDERVRQLEAEVRAWDDHATPRLASVR